MVKRVFSRSSKRPCWPFACSSMANGGRLRNVFCAPPPHANVRVWRFERRNEKDEKRRKTKKRLYRNGPRPARRLRERHIHRNRGKKRPGNHGVVYSAGGDVSGGRESDGDGGWPFRGNGFKRKTWKSNGKRTGPGQNERLKLSDLHSVRRRAAAAIRTDPETDVPSDPSDTADAARETGRSFCVFRTDYPVDPYVELWRKIKKKPQTIAEPTSADPWYAGISWVVREDVFWSNKKDFNEKYKSA